MKVKKLLLSALVLLSFTINISAQATFDSKATLTLEQIDNNVKGDDGFVFNDFVKANVHQTAGPEFSKGIIRDQLINFNANTNTFYLKQGDNVLELNSNSIKGVYTNSNGNFMKCNEDFPNDFCEVIHMTEDIFVYKLKNTYYSKIGSTDQELPLTTNAIETAFNLKSGMVDKYISANNLDINNKEDLKIILNQYEALEK